MVGRSDPRQGGEQREVQVAQLRHTLDIQILESLAWSPTALVTIGWITRTNCRPKRRTTPSALRWGPDAPGVAYVARLSEAEDDWYGGRKELRLTSGPLYEAHFGDLLPDTLYRVEVYLDEGRAFGYPLKDHRFELRTEPEPDGWTPLSRSPTDILAIAVGGVLEVTWTPPPTGVRHKTLVCAYPSENSWGQQCVTVRPGQSRAHLPLAGPGQGGTFQIQVDTLTAPPGTGQAEIHVPSYDLNLPAGGVTPAAPRFMELRWAYSSLELHRPTSGNLEVSVGTSRRRFGRGVLAAARSQHGSRNARRRVLSQPGGWEGAGGGASTAAPGRGLDALVGASRRSAAHQSAPQASIR